MKQLNERLEDQRKKARDEPEGSSALEGCSGNEREWRGGKMCCCALYNTTP